MLELHVAELEGCSTVPTTSQEAFLAASSGEWYCTPQEADLQSLDPASDRPHAEGQARAIRLEFVLCACLLFTPAFVHTSPVVQCQLTNASKAKDAAEKALKRVESEAPNCDFTMEKAEILKLVDALMYPGTSNFSIFIDFDRAGGYLDELATAGTQDDALPNCMRKLLRGLDNKVKRYKAAVGFVLSFE
jgi:hypothetical protein